MYKYILAGLVLFGAGVVLGHFLLPEDRGNDASMRSASHVAPSPFVAVDESVKDNVQQMDERLVMLEQRIALMEIALAAAETDTESNEEETADIAETSDSGLEKPATGDSRILSIENLTRAGLDEQLASDIVRRKNQLELLKLELRDRASRESYLGTRRYKRELAKLNTEDISLRDEIGDQAYDRYLYTSGQTNRVRVASVMLGSAAEQAGIVSGDLILNYNGQTVFKWSELQQATTEGQLGDYVSLGVMRDGVELSMWLPRGPLGVRLGSARLDPDT